MYAIVKTGGKQYKVAEGSTITVEKLEGEPEAIVELTDVLLFSNDDGLQVGSPTVTGVKVIASIVGQVKAKKINGYTFKPKKNIHHRYGHRQKLTTLHIERIEA